MRVIIDGVVARLAVTSFEVDGSVVAEEVVDDKVELLLTRGNVVVVEVVVGAHLVCLSCSFFDLFLFLSQYLQRVECPCVS